MLSRHKYNIGHLTRILAFSLWSMAMLAQRQGTKIPSFVWAEHITHSDGLTLNGIRDFCNDRNGMVWVAGQNALVRFSGAAFQYYFPADSVHKNGLEKGVFQSLDIDADNRIWTSSTSGLYWLDEVKDSFCRIKSPFEHGWHDAPRYIAFDPSKKYLWMADERGLYKWEVATQTWDQTAFGTLQIPSFLLTTQEGKVLIVDDKGSYLYDPIANTTLKQYTHAKVALETNDGSIWLGTWRGGLRRIDPVTLNEEIFYPPGDYEHNVYGEAILGLGVVPSLTGDHILWCGTQENGVFFFDIVQKKFVGHLNWDERNSTGLPQHLAGLMHIDPAGVLWLDQGGITRITPFRQQLIEQKILGLKAVDTRGLFVKDIIQDKHRPNHQWLAISYYGLVSYNNITKEVEKWWFYKPNTPILKRERNYRVCIAYDQKGNLWASTETGFLVIDKRFQTQEIAIQQYNNATTAVHQFVFDEYNHCWMATELGLCRYTLENKGFKAFINHGLHGSNIVRDLSLGNGGLWLATENGIQFFDHTTMSFTGYTFLANGHDLKSKNKFFSIFQSKSGNIYALNEQGLVTLHQGQLKQLCEIPFANMTHPLSIIEDEQGYIWVNAFAILYKIDPKSGQIVGKFNCAGGYFQKLSDGTLQLSGYNAFVAFDPSTLSDFDYTHKPVFTAFKVYDKRVHVHFDSASTTPFVLNWRQNALTFDYDCPDFTSFMETTYEVKLEGYDREWKLQGKKRNITYTNLPPGDYAFHVRATNLMGAKHPENTVFRFRIKPPFWQTWWFRFLVLSAITAAIWFVFRSRVQAIRKEEARKTEFYRLKAETEMRALRAQMNPHFIFNCMNTIEAFIIEQREEDATTFLQKFSKLIRAVLENAQHDTVPLQLELEVLEWYIQLEQIRVNHRWTYQISISPDINMGQMQIPPLILQPFVENAILHGLYHRGKKGGELHINITCDQEKNILATITDNGIGRLAASTKNKHLANKKKSLGIQFSIDRVRKLNPPDKMIYDITTTDLDPDQIGMTGTLVEIRMPGGRER